MRKQFESRDTFEMAKIPSDEDKVASNCCCRDQKVEIRQFFAVSFQRSAQCSKYFHRFFVERSKFDERH